MSGDPYDPDRHETQLVAAFERRQIAEGAREALLGAGLPAHAVEVVGDAAAGPSPGGEGFWHAIRSLFAPADEAHELGEALRNGNVMVVVHPQTVAERDSAIEVLEGCGPIDLEERSAPARLELNHASLSRADLVASAQPQAAEPPAAPPEPVSEAASGTTYTYGVPETVAQAMTAEEQVLVQAPDPQSRQQFVRIVEERLRVGWRDPGERPTRVRRYVAERDTAGQRVELLEEEIPASTERPIS